MTMTAEQIEQMRAAVVVQFNAGTAEVHQRRRSFPTTVIMQFLSDYDGSLNFINSIASQVKSGRNLTESQLSAVDRFMAKPLSETQQNWLAAHNIAAVSNNFEFELLMSVHREFWLSRKTGCLLCVVARRNNN